MRGSASSGVERSDWPRATYSLCWGSSGGSFISRRRRCWRSWSSRSSPSSSTRWWSTQSTVPKNVVSSTRQPKREKGGMRVLATLSVLKFNDPGGADRVLLALQGMQERQLITLEDAAVVSWPADRKKPKTRQLSSTTGGGAAFGAFWGLVFGVIFFVPLLGMAVGAGIGALSGSLADVGIDEAFINKVREKVTPGTSALFALTSGATEDQVIEELKQYDFEIISTTLPEEQEQKLREAFGEEPYVSVER